jgi:hypothetical protein
MVLMIVSACFLERVKMTFVLRRPRSQYPDTAEEAIHHCIDHVPPWNVGGANILFLSRKGVAGRCINAVVSILATAYTYH